MNNDRITVDLSTLIFKIKHALVWIILAAILFGVVGFVVLNYFTPRKYESSVMMIVKNENVGNKQLTSDDLSAAKKLAKTYSVILKSDLVLEKVIYAQELDMSYEELSKMIEVEAERDTDVLKITVTCEDPQESYEICSTMANIAPDAITGAVDFGSCHAVSKVTLNEKPVSPHVIKYTVFWTLVGALVALGVVLYRVTNTRVSVVDDNDVKEYLDLPVLAVIPDVEKG